MRDINGLVPESECVRTCKKQSVYDLYRRALERAGNALLRVPKNQSVSVELDITEGGETYIVPFNVTRETRNVTEILGYIADTFHFQSTNPTGYDFEVYTSTDVHGTEPVAVYRFGFFMYGYAQLSGMAPPHVLFPIADVIACALCHVYNKDRYVIYISDAHTVTLTCTISTGKPFSVFTRLWLVLQRGYGYYANRGYTFEFEGDKDEDALIAHINDVRSLTFKSLRECKEMIDAFGYTRSPVESDGTLSDLVHAVHSNDCISIERLILELFPDLKRRGVEKLFEDVEDVLIEMLGFKADGKKYVEDLKYGAYFDDFLIRIGAMATTVHGRYTLK